MLHHLIKVTLRKGDTSAFWMAVAFIILALCIPGYQAMLWLESGYWSPVPISYVVQFLGWHFPMTD